MLRGLQGRRVALATLPEVADEQVSAVRKALEQVGAEVSTLQVGKGTDEEWHAGRFAALVAVGVAGGEHAEPRVVQLAREFLASEKPVAVLGGALGIIVDSGGAAGRTLAADRAVAPTVQAAGGTVVDEPIHSDGSLISAQTSAGIEAFAKRVVQEFARQLEEGEVDSMSEQSFPASDPPGSHFIQ